MFLFSFVKATDHAEEAKFYYNIFQLRNHAEILYSAVIECVLSKLSELSYGQTMYFPRLQDS